MTCVDNVTEQTERYFLSISFVPRPLTDSTSRNVGGGFVIMF